MKFSRRTTVYLILLLSFLLIPVYNFAISRLTDQISLVLLENSLFVYAKVISVVGYCGIILKLKKSLWYYLIVVGLILHILLLHLNISTGLLLFDVGVIGEIINNGYSTFLSLLGEFSIVLFIYLNAEIIIRYKPENSDLLSQ